MGVIDVKIDFDKSKVYSASEVADDLIEVLEALIFGKNTTPYVPKDSVRGLAHRTSEDSHVNG